MGTEESSARNRAEQIAFTHQWWWTAALEEADVYENMEEGQGTEDVRVRVNCSREMGEKNRGMGGKEKDLICLLLDPVLLDPKSTGGERENSWWVPSGWEVVVVLVVLAIWFYSRVAKFCEYIRAKKSDKIFFGCEIFYILQFWFCSRVARCCEYICTKQEQYFNCQ